MFVDDFLAELDALLGDVELGEAEEVTDALRELIPELDDLCKNVWLLELVVDFCKRGKRG